MSSQVTELMHSQPQQTQPEILPHLFRTEFRKMCSMLCRRFGVDRIDLVEDIVCDVFARALESWSFQGLPTEPVAWLYRVAQNLAANQFQREQRYQQKVLPELIRSAESIETSTARRQRDEAADSWSSTELLDSQLAMFFLCCDPELSEHSQLALALRIMCGFSTEEIAKALLSTAQAVEKRLQRARVHMRSYGRLPELPAQPELQRRLHSVCTIIYLMFGEGYYSDVHPEVLREDLCAEAMHLAELLMQHSVGQQPMVYAVYALMCFHASRFAARRGPNAELVLYADQNVELWDKELQSRGARALRAASQGEHLTEFHLEAAIAFWQCEQSDSAEKNQSILSLYDTLLSLKPTSQVQLNRVLALSRVKGIEHAREELKRSKLEPDYYYYLVEAELVAEGDLEAKRQALRKAAACCAQEKIRQSINTRIEGLGLHRVEL